MIIPSLCVSITRWVGAFLLGGVILWQVAEHSGPSAGRAIVHVVTPRVDLTVDETTYQVESIWMSPIVCELRPGRHTVRMFREGRLLYEEDFLLKAGEEMILTAWDGYKDGRSPPQAGRGCERTASTGPDSAQEPDCQRRSNTGSR
jgi:hypothetical protein